MSATRLHRVSPLVLLAAAGAARAQCAPLQLFASDPAANVYNGYAVALDGPCLLTGALGKVVSGQTDAGCAYAFAPVNGVWSQVAHMESPNPVSGDYFGCSVALGGGAEWGLVGARGYVGSSGKAFLYRRDPGTGQWGYWTNLGPGASGSAFGSSVALNSAGTIAVVGAPVATITDGFGSTFAAGQVMVYTRTGNTWFGGTDLHQTNGAIRHSNDGYGYSVACDGSTVVAGVISGGTAAQPETGYIHIWTLAGNQWTNSGEVFAPDRSFNACFGSGVAVSGSVMAVGARNVMYQGLVGAGCVYMYRQVNGAWVYDQTIHASDPAAGDSFGENVTMSGDTVGVSTWITSQKAYVFRRTPAGQWVQDARYTNPGGAGENFAYGIAVGGGKVAMGTDQRPLQNTANVGCTYLYDLPSVGSDSCEGATPVGQGSVSGCTDHCTMDGASPCGTGSPVGPDIWFSYTAPATGPVTINTQGSSLDTILSVHNGCPGTQANTMVCNDDFAAPQRWSKVTAGVVAGHTYLIRIAGYGGSVGNFTLNIGPVGGCYANCDNSTAAPVLNVLDFSCFLNKFAAGDPAANCDGSTAAPVLNVNDFSCFLNKFAAGCP